MNKNTAKTIPIILAIMDTLLSTFCKCLLLNKNIATSASRPAIENKPNKAGWS